MLNENHPMIPLLAGFIASTFIGSNTEDTRDAFSIERAYVLAPNTVAVRFVSGLTLQMKVSEADAKVMEALGRIEARKRENNDNPNTIQR